MPQGNPALGEGLHVDVVHADGDARYELQRRRRRQQFPVYPVCVECKQRFTTCLFEGGQLCLGPVARAGCEALCPQGNMPCTGCFGPTSRVKDQGGKILSAVTSIIDSDDQEKVEEIAASIADPIGTFYRYGLPGSLLRRRKVS